MNFIVSVDNKWNIGKNNDLLFHVSSDMKFFKNTTIGKTVVMGDKTFLSLPGSKPLIDRKNIVISLDSEFKAEGTTVMHGLNELAEYLLSLDSTKDVFVIGGATIYNLLIPFCSTAYVTKFDTVRDDAEVSIVNLDELSNWSIEKSIDKLNESDLDFEFLLYKNSSVKSIKELL